MGIPLPPGLLRPQPPQRRHLVSSGPTIGTRTWMWMSIWNEFFEKTKTKTTTMMRRRRTWTTIVPVIICSFTNSNDLSDMVSVLLLRLIPGCHTVVLALLFRELFPRALLSLDFLGDLLWLWFHLGCCFRVLLILLLLWLRQVIKLGQSTVSIMSPILLFALLVQCQQCHEMSLP